jgi:hypothetical protein
MEGMSKAEVLGHKTKKDMSIIFSIFRVLG